MLSWFFDYLVLHAQPFFSLSQPVVFLGHSVTQSKNLSDSTVDLIDKEVKLFIDQASEKCRKILTENIKELHIVAKGLIEYETLTLAEVMDLLKGIQPTRDNDDSNIEDDNIKPSKSVPETGAEVSPQPQ